MNNTTNNKSSPKSLGNGLVATPHGRKWTRPLRVFSGRGRYAPRFSIKSLLFVIVMEALSRQLSVALPRKLLYADDLVVIAETEDDLIKRLNEWKDFVENRTRHESRLNMNKTKVMISGERQKVMQKAVKWPCGVCGRGVGNNSIQFTSCQKWVHRKRSG